MGPIRGLRKRRRVEKRAEREHIAPSLHTGDWWDEFSRRIAGSLSLFLMTLFSLFALSVSCHAYFAWFFI